MILYDVVKNFDSLCTVGMCKNAGKTTVLNSVITAASCEGFNEYGLTSIGRDGESTDVATRTPKPAVYVGAGTIFATAQSLVSLCDTTLEILGVTDFHTPLGKVVIAKAISDGNIQIAGPSTVEGLKVVSAMMTDFGAKRIIVDGAISRKTLSVPSLCDGAVLCTSASYDMNINTVVADTAHSVRLLTLEKCDDGFVRDDAVFTDTEQKKALIYFGENTESISFDALPETLKKNYKAVTAILVNGALTESTAKMIYESGCTDTKIILHDPTKAMIGIKTLEKLTMRRIRLSVLDKPTLAAVTVNPYSAYGVGFSATTFLDMMREAILWSGVPVFDVLGE